MERAPSDHAQFLRAAWANRAYADITLAIRVSPEGGGDQPSDQEGGGDQPSEGSPPSEGQHSEAPAPHYVDCIKLQLAKHSPVFRWAAAAAAAVVGATGRHLMPCNGKRGRTHQLVGTPHAPPAALPQGAD